MKIAILGTRGIPNNYGGFEQFAEYISVGLVTRGHEVCVYNSHNHKYQGTDWKGVKLIHCYDPEFRMGTAGQFFYDLNCILDSRKRGFDIILQLGYTSSSIWSFLFPKSTLVVTNMDGLEWKRSKYGKLTRKFLKYAEGLAVKKSDYLVSDSLGIRSYILEQYHCDSEYIPYGASVFGQSNASVLNQYNLRPYAYDMLIARLEPENSIEMILDGVASSEVHRPFVVIGNNKTAFGQYLVNKFKTCEKIKFAGSIYDMEIVNNLRFFSNLYFHGHTVGGTNPSLLEAMASDALLAAHKNEFNASILGNDAYFFSNADDVRKIVSEVTKDDAARNKINANRDKIRNLYSWEKILDRYEAFFLKLPLKTKKQDPA